VELVSLRRLFGNAISTVSMSSTKSAIGHLLGGAGAVESIFCILALRDQIVQPTLNLDNPSESCDGVDLEPQQAREARASISCRTRRRSGLSAPCSTTASALAAPMHASS